MAEQYDPQFAPAHLRLRFLHKKIFCRSTKNEWKSFHNGAVSDMCEECYTCHDRTGRLVVAGQSDPLFVPSVMNKRTHLWPMILRKKKIYCKDTKNELKGYHNKIV